jgi:hypothetical protein
LRGIDFVSRKDPFVSFVIKSVAQLHGDDEALGGLAIALALTNLADWTRFGDPWLTPQKRE